MRVGNVGCWKRQKSCAARHFRHGPKRLPLSVLGSSMLHPVCALAEYSGAAVHFHGCSFHVGVGERVLDIPTDSGRAMEMTDRLDSLVIGDRARNSVAMFDTKKREEKWMKRTLAGRLALGRPSLC